MDSIDYQSLTKRSRYFLFQSFFGEFDYDIAPSAWARHHYKRGKYWKSCLFYHMEFVRLSCLTMPAFLPKNNMPIGVQLIGKPEFDDKLLGIGGWLLEKLNNCEVGILNDEKN